MLSTTLLAAAGLIWAGSHAPAAAQSYNGGPNQVIVNMDVLNGLPGGYGTGYGAPNAQGQAYGQAPKSQFLPGAAPQGYGTDPAQLAAPLGAPRYLPPYTPYGVAGAGAQPLPLAPGLAGLATPPASSPSSVLTTLGPDGRPIQPIKLKQPGTGTKQASKPKKKEYAAPAQPAATEPMPEPTPAASDEQVAAIEPPTPPAEPATLPDTVPMPEPTPAPSATGAVVETAPAVAAPEPAAEAPAEEQAAAPEAPAPEAPAEEAPAEEASAQETPAAEAPAEAAPEAPAAEATATETTGETTSETAAAEAPVPDNSAPAAPIPQGGIRIVFPSEVNEVPAEANAALDDLASQMLADENMRIQIMCYASGTEETESKARRKSLARCINIRQYLFKKDVRTTRMDVRALGLKSEGQPADRVDIVPASS